MLCVTNLGAGAAGVWGRLTGLLMQVRVDWLVGQKSSSLGEMERAGVIAFTVDLRVLRC